MGIAERDYERDSYGRPPGVHIGGPRSMTVKLLLITIGVYVAQLFFGVQFTEIFGLHANWYLQPWRFFELLTYGFLHSPSDLKHILFNMFVFWMFGRTVEMRYGSKEFLCFYLTAIVLAGAAWNVFTLASGGGFAFVLGASGGVSAVVILFALTFPREKILFMFVIPMPAWVFGLIIVGLDLMGAMGRDEAGNVAFTAHLAGAAFAFLYYKFRWRLADRVPTSFKMPKIKRGPKLRVHDPAEPADSDDNSEVDNILRKIQQQGQDSLTSRERRILERASREYQQKRR